METERDKQKGINIPFAVISQLQRTRAGFFSTPICGLILWQQLDFDTTIDLNLRENTNLNPPGATGTLF